jgi:aconitate hydratase
MAAVLSGNRNFEGRVNPHTRANYLASPPLVVAYALLGTVAEDITSAPIGVGKDGKPVFLRDIWPSNAEITDCLRRALTPAMFKSRYSDVFKGDSHWQNIKTSTGSTFAWDAGSTYVQHPPYFVDMSHDKKPLADFHGMRPLAILGDSVTTDHISPAGNIKKDSPAGKYLTEQGVSAADFNSYGARRGNHEVMVRGTFANIRLVNEMVPGVSGGVTKLMPHGTTMSIYDASVEYLKTKTPLLIIAGKEYGTGSSRDWAAKGTRLLGVEAVLAESFERIHRSNLVGMGVLPLQFLNGATRQSLELTGDCVFALSGLSGGITPKMTLGLEITRPDGHKQTVPVLCRIDTLDEVEYYRSGGILPFVLKRLVG